MQNMLKLLLLSTSLSFVAAEAIASETAVSEIIAIKPTNTSALLDGSCGNDEWDAATKIELPAQASIYLMHDEDYFYFCAKGKAEDYTVIDLYIEHAETGRLHKFHLSAQMGEGILTDDGWENASAKGVHKDYAGFWVPYVGLEDQKNRKNPKFARGTHRQIQILRKKFAGNIWNMMVGVSVRHEGNRAELFYPEKAVGNDKATWGKFSFSE